MKSAQKISQWQAGEVDKTKEHFELRYGSIEDGGWDKWRPVAIVGYPKAGIVKVQFFIKPDDPQNAKVISAVERELKNYIIEKGEPRPWEYMKYHCGTSANVYSKVHWSFCDPRGGVKKSRAANKMGN
jgi:hypothetical protein